MINSTLSGGGLMFLGKLSLIFKVSIVILIYIIIFLALKIMYKDIKNGGNKNKRKRRLGLEIIEIGDNDSLRNGGIIPIDNKLTIGRKKDNLLILTDRFISSYHVKIYLKNNEYIIADLDSTNGTFINSKRIKGKKIIHVGDNIKIGTVLFKVIG